MPKIFKKDLTGQKFGRLLVIYWDKEKSINHSKHHFWMCQCSCDNKIISVRQDHLIGNKIVSCGCFQKEQQLKNKKENKYEVYENIVKIYTSNTNEPFYINYIDFDKIIKHCWYEDKKGYICSRINNHIIRLHRYILELYDNNFQVDHKDRNKKIILEITLELLLILKMH